MTADTAAHDFLIECGLTDDEADHAIALAVRDAADEVERLRADLADAHGEIEHLHGIGRVSGAHRSIRDQRNDARAERDASRTAHAALVAELRALHAPRDTEVRTIECGAHHAHYATYDAAATSYTEACFERVALCNASGTRQDECSTCALLDRHAPEEGE